MAETWKPVGPQAWRRSAARDAFHLPSCSFGLLGTEPRTAILRGAGVEEAHVQGLLRGPRMTRSPRSLRTGAFCSTLPLVQSEDKRALFYYAVMKMKGNRVCESPGV